MCCFSFKNLVPFGLAALLGISAFYLLTPISVPPPQISGSGTGFGSGSGSGGGSGSGFGSGSTRPVRSEAGLVIISKPQATYTDAARADETQGTVRLKVTLLSDGTVGEIKSVSELPNGLTEQAIEAARKIKFEPKLVDGIPVSTTVTIDYSFSIY